MKPESIALCNSLLEVHRERCVTGEEDYRDCVIPYGELCDRAGIPHILRIVGHFLIEIAEWCHENGWPPLNALAVNAGDEQPGDNYALAPGCSLLNWPQEVRDCIRWRQYPQVYMG